MMKIFDFGSIEANKAGKKSDRQVKEIKEAANPGIWLYGGLGILVLGGCFYIMMASMQSDGGGAVGVFALILALVGFVAALRGFTTWNLRRKLLTEPVQSAEGTVIFKFQNALGQLIEADHFVAETTDGRKIHPIGLAGVNPQLPPGDYRFYFLNTRNWLLAAEPLSSEAELRDNLNQLLATVLGFEKNYLEDCRREAREGKLKTAEAMPKMDASESVSTGDDDLSVSEYYCTVGDFKLQVSSTAYAAIIPGIRYRVYYREEEAGTFAAMEIA